MSAAARCWETLTWQDFAALDTSRCVAVLPFGAVEQHGPHLPTGTDRVIVDAVVADALARLPDDVPALLMPTQAIGLSIEHARYPGTLTGRPGTLLALWTEIGAGVARAGLRKLVLVNSHGGNSGLIGLVAQTLRCDHGLMAVPHHCYRLWRNDPAFDDEERRHGIHGGGIETSVMLAAAPEAVRMDRAAHFRPASTRLEQDTRHLAPEGRVAYAWEMQDLHPAGAAGNAAAADAARGRALIAAAGEELAALVGEVSAADPALVAGPLPGNQES